MNPNGFSFPLYFGLSVLLLVPPRLPAQARKPPPLLRSTFYVGEGWAELGTDTGKAREQAKTRALGDLARNVRVSVKSVIIDVLGQTAQQPRQSLESRVDAYAEIPLTRLDREEFVLNHPRRGQLTCRVAVNRDRFDGEIRRDLTTKKNRALEDARSSLAALRDGRWADAWTTLAAVKQRAAADFPDLSLEGDIDGDGKNEDVLAWVQERRAEIRGALQLTCAPGPFVYGDDGRYSGEPTARITAKGQAPISLKGFPLCARWAHRPESVADQSRSGENGEVVFRPSADPFVESTVLRVELEGDEDPSGAFCQSAFHRRRQAVLSVRSDRVDVQGRVEEEVLSRLKRWPWDVRTAGDEDTFSGALQRISLVVDTGVARHPDGNLYRAAIKIHAHLFSGISGKTVYKGEGPSAVGFGATPADAVRRGLDALLHQLGPWLDQTAKNLP